MLPPALAAWQAEGAFFDLLGERVFVRQEGSGPPLLLLHAYPTASWGFHRILPGLTARFRVIAPDLPGSGLSSKPRRGDYSIARLGDVVEALLDRLQVGRLHVLAHGYTASVAQELLARDNVRAAKDARLMSLCFLSAGLFPEVAQTTRLQRLMLSPLGPLLARFAPQPFGIFSKQLAESFGRKTQPSEEDLQIIWALLRANGGQRVVPRVIGYLTERQRVQDRLVGALEQARVPLALMVAPDDDLSGEAILRVWRRRLPLAPVYRLPDGVGHYPPLECPQDVQRAYAAFRGAITTAPA
ncbi:MAG: alpha/beta hydrolase [Pseudomonadota bacterium]